MSHLPADIHRRLDAPAQPRVECHLVTAIFATDHEAGHKWVQQMHVSSEMLEDVNALTQLAESLARLHVERQGLRVVALQRLAVMDEAGANVLRIYERGEWHVPADRRAEAFASSALP